jgi:L-arginine---[L-arginyl-carrier protein] ligase
MTCNTSAQENTGFPSDHASDNREILPLLATQQGIWLADQLAEEDHVYAITHCVELQGKLNPEHLETAIRIGLSEADTVMAEYRHSQPDADGLPTCQVRTRTPLADVPALQWLDASSLPLATPEQTTDQLKALAFDWMWQQSRTPCSLQNQSPLQAQIIIRLTPAGHEPQHWLWFQKFHHLMLDGFSFTALTRRISTLYKQLYQQQTLTRSPFTPVQQVVDEYRQYHNSPEWQQDRDFWLQDCTTASEVYTLSQQGPADNLPTARIISHQQILNNDIRQRLLHVTEELASPLKAAQRPALSDWIMAWLLAYLARYTGLERHRIGIPFMRRMGSAAIRSLAPVVNVLPVQIDIPRHCDWLTLASDLKLILKRIRRHQRYDAEQIQRDQQQLHSRPGKLYGPLLNYKLFDFQLEIPDAIAHTHHLATGPIDDFEFGILLHPDQILIELRAEQGRYQAAELRQHGKRLQQLLEHWLAQPDTPIQQLPLLTADEYRDIQHWGRGDVININPHEQTILDSLFAQLQQQPDTLAVISGQQQASSLQLQNRIQQLTRLLIQQQIGPGQVVAVAIPRSIDTLTAMLAVMNSGATFMPVDLDYPVERIAMMCEDASPALLLSSAGNRSRFPPDLPYLDPEQWPQVLPSLSTRPVTDAERLAPLRRSTLAYVIFTSGSTGRPKGVMNSHGALLNLLNSHRHSIYGPALAQQQARYPGRPLRAAHTHSFSFDSSWLQVFWMVLGQTLIIFDEEERRDAFALAAAIDHLNIDAMDLSPSFCAQLLNVREQQLQTQPPSQQHQHQLTLILLGGEAAPAALWQQLRTLHQRHGLLSHNLYGPTEYTVDTLRASIDQQPSAVIGRPIANTCVWVLDNQLRPLPPGVMGELYISGAGLADGYLGRAGLTASRFIANPFTRQPGERLYRTGDLVRWRDDGQLEYLGRGDDQVKIRGYRVEPGEVENALSLLPGIESSLVIAEAIHNSQRLLAYCVPADPGQWQHISRADQSQQWLQQLRQQLPDYMVPSLLLIVDEFPRNLSGKIDRKALPSVQQWLQQFAEPDPETESASSEHPATLMLLQETARILKLTSISLQADFFALGGDSISAIMLCAALRKQGYQLRPASIFNLRQIQAIATGISQLDVPLTSPADCQQTSAQDQQLTAVYGQPVRSCAVLPLQQGMLFQTCMETPDAVTGSGNSYNAFTRLHLQGPLDITCLQQSLNQQLQRYPQLCGLFDTDTQAQPLFVHPRASHHYQWPLAIHDLSGLPADQQQQQLTHLQQHLLRQTTDTRVFNGMIRAALFKLDHQHWQLLLMVHHLLIDGWSSPLLLASLCSDYRQQVMPHSADITRLTTTSQPSSKLADYADVVNQLAARPAAPARDHWQKVLAQVTPTLLFATASANAAASSTVADKKAGFDTVEETSLTLSPGCYQQLQTQLQQRGLTLNALMQGLWAMALSGLSGRQDLVFGTPVAGRSAAIDGLQQQVGLFLNTLPVRVRLNPLQSLWQQLQHIQQQHLDNLEHDSIGLAEIQQLAGVTSLFDSLLVVENYPDNDYLTEVLSPASNQAPALTISAVDNRGYSHYPLALLVIPGDGLTLLIENRQAVNNAKALTQRLQQWLQLLLDQPDLPLCQWPMTSPMEQALIDRSNHTRHAVPATTLRQLLQQQALSSPNAIALEDTGQCLSFIEVRQQVCYLARQLRHSGIGSGDIVAVALPRSVRLSIAILAVIEAGAAYLPMELDYPDERLAIMLQDSRAVCLITSSARQQRFSDLQQQHRLDIPVQFFDQLATVAELTILAPDLSAAMKSSDQHIGLTPAHPAYLIFTSGTTGRPKGVLVSHQAIVNRILWMQHQYPLTASDCILQKTPCSFDVSVWEFFWSFITGARLVMAAVDIHKDPQALATCIEHFGVTTLHFVPSMLALFCATHESPDPADRRCPGLRQVFCSGEALSKNQARHFAEIFSAHLHNLYGPTEAAVDVSWHPAFGRTLDHEINNHSTGVPIGLPVWNTQLRILDQYLRQVAPGCTGELYLSGKQLALGYQGRADLSASRFVADPYGQDGDRMYRTGDLACWLADGTVAYLGRADDQIKIRGQRVEPGEIESCLRQQPEVAEAVVQAVSLGIDHNNMDNRQLLCWLIATDSIRQQWQDSGNSHERSSALGQQLRERLAQNLPAHMVPVAVIWLQHLPLSPNGKLDRKALPLPDQQALPVTAKRLPLAGLETRLATLFERFIGRPVMADDDFFAIGGHSLLAMQLAAAIRKELKRNVTVGQLITTPSVAALAEQLNAGVMLNDFGHKGFDPVLPLRQGQGPQLLCFYPGSGFAWQYSVLSRYLDPQWRITGLQSPRPHGLLASSRDMSEMISGQLSIIRAQQPHGPYYLLGYSLGGSVAYQIAERLQAAGEEVAFLGLLDTYPAEVHNWNDPQGAEATAGAEQEQTRLLSDAVSASHNTETDQDARLERDAMLAQIFANYQDAVRILAASRTPTYSGRVTLFVAEQQQPHYLQPQHDWMPYVRQLELHYLPTSHENILSPATLQELGPLLNRLLTQSQQTSQQAANGSDY